MALPAELLNDPLRPNYGNSSLIFFKEGPCSQYPNVAHYYFLSRENEWFDLYNASCLNGWVSDAELFDLQNRTILHEPDGDRVC